MACGLFAALLMWGCATTTDPNAGPGDGDGDGDGDRPDAGVTPDAPVEPVSVVLSHSSSEDVVAQNSTACVVSATILGVRIDLFTEEASYFRTFDLAAEGVDRDLQVTRVRVGIETADAGEATEQPLDVRLHTVNGALAMANLTQVASAQIQVADQGAGVVPVDIAATIPAGSTLAVEVHAPTGDPDRFLFIGSNGAGQTAPTFWRSPGCGDDEPVDAPDGMHMVLSVEGTY